MWALVLGTTTSSGILAGRCRQDDLDVVRAMMDAWTAQRVDELLGAFHPDVELADLQTVMGMHYPARSTSLLLAS